MAYTTPDHLRTELAEEAIALRRQWTELSEDAASKTQYEEASIDECIELARTSTDPALLLRLRGFPTIILQNPHTPACALADIAQWRVGKTTAERVAAIFHPNASRLASADAFLYTDGPHPYSLKWEIATHPALRDDVIRMIAGSRDHFMIEERDDLPLDVRIALDPYEPPASAVS